VIGLFVCCCGNSAIHPSAFSQNLNRRPARPLGRQKTTTTMLSKAARSSNAVRYTLSKGMATAAPRIGDTKVEMSPLEQGNYINYQRIEDNLSVVRSRCVIPESVLYVSLTMTRDSQAQPTSHTVRKDCVRSLRRRAQPRYSAWC